MGSVRLPTGELLYPQGQGMNTPRLKKLYLIMILSTICIFFFQYHISRAQLDEQPVQEVLLPDALVDQKQTLPKGAIVRHQEPMRELLLADSSSSGQQVTRDESNDVVNSPPIFPPIYVITPTFRRAEQLAEITRLGYTLKHVPNLHWLVMEDSNTTTPMVTKLLVKIGVPFTHLVAPMPAKYKKNKIKPRGVSNRNRGLQWIRKNATDGVIYFADDDNSYDVSLFEEIRYTKKIAMFPVGLVTSVGVSSPIVVNGTITGFYDGWIAGRKYPVDMAGFAVNVKFFLERPKAKMPYTPGYEEDGFLKSLHPFDLKDIQIFANNCTEILVWHTQTKKNAQAAKLDYTKYNGTNIIALRDILW